MMETAHKKHGNIAGIMAAYFLIYVVWGSTYFFIGVALSDFLPFLLGALRFMAAGLILLAICYWRGEKVFRKRLIGRSAITGIVLLFVDMAVVMLAQRYVTSSFVAIIASSTALWILLLDVPMWKTNFRSWLSAHSEWGFMLLIAGCISWSLGTIYAKYRSCHEEEVNAFSGSAWQMLFASIMFWLCALVMEMWRRLISGRCRRQVGSRWLI